MNDLENFIADHSGSGYEKEIRKVEKHWIRDQL